MKDFLTSIRYQLDCLLYIGISECGYWQAVSDPIDWKKVVGGIGVGLIAWKAKRSGGIETSGVTTTVATTPKVEG